MAALEDFEAQIEPVEYLARSPSRLKVLESINEEPRSRHELREQTDVSRVTLSRVLSNFEERGWIVRMSGDYQITAEGAFVATELTRLLGNMRTLEHLDGAMRWLPVEAFDFDLACLEDADVSTADWGNHTAQIRAVADTISGADRIVATASGVSHDVVAALRDVTVDGAASLEVMFDDTAIDIVAGDPELRRLHREMLDSGNADVLLYEGDRVPLLMLTVCDDTVILCGHDEDGPPPGTLETTDETVRAWAEGYFDSIREDSSPIDTAVFDD